MRGGPEAEPVLGWNAHLVAPESFLDLPAYAFHLQLDLRRRLAQIVQSRQKGRPEASRIPASPKPRDLDIAACCAGERMCSHISFETKATSHM